MTPTLQQFSYSKLLNQVHSSIPPSSSADNSPIIREERSSTTIARMQKASRRFLELTAEETLRKVTPSIKTKFL